MEKNIEKNIELDKDDKIKKLRHINGLMREMLEYMRSVESQLGIRPTKFPSFVYEQV